MKTNNTPQEKFDKNLSDTIDANIADTPFIDLPEVLKEQTAEVDLSKIGQKKNLPDAPSLEEDHKLVIPELPTLEYRYELEPRTINGQRYFEYGITATANKTKFEGFLLHHMGNSDFDNSLNYILKHDEERGGTFGYHFLIGRDGRAVQAAPLSKRTNHVSPENKRYAQKHLMNPNTVSLSLHGGYRREGGDYVHIPPTDKQLFVSKIILRALSNIYNLSLLVAWGHGEVQSNRMTEEAQSLALWCRNL